MQCPLMGYEMIQILHNVIHCVRHKIKEKILDVKKEERPLYKQKKDGKTINFKLIQVL